MIERNMVSSLDINYNQTGAKSQEGHSIVKNTGGGEWLDSLGSGILVGKINFGVYKNI